MDTSIPVIFRDLPATFPEEDRFRKPSFISSVSFHVLLLSTVLLIPLLLPKHISDHDLLLTLLSPLAPPPAALPAPLAMPVASPAAAVPRPVTDPDADALYMPAAIPQEIARIVDEPQVMDAGGVIGGVVGGVPGGTGSGVLGAFLALNSRSPDLPAPPPPPPVQVVAAPAPPPVTQPVRVGGQVREPRVLKLVSPVYPRLASQARVGGDVVLEAVLTVEGTVEEIRVISGHPLLVQAAIDSVKQWVYEPTMLNGVPVPVVLTARVHFAQRPAS